MSPSPSLNGARADDQLTPRALSARLSANPSGAEAEQLAKSIRSWFGATQLAQGANPKVSGLEVAWAIEAPNAKEVRVLGDGGHTFPLQAVGQTGSVRRDVPAAGRLCRSLGLPG